MAVVVFDDLLHCPARAGAKGLDLDLDGGDAGDQEHHVVAVVAVAGVDAELVDDLEGVLALVLDVDEGAEEGRAVIAREGVDLAEGAGGGEHVGGDDLVEQTLELAIGEGDAVEGLEVPAEVGFEGGTVPSVGAANIPEGAKRLDEVLFELVFE